MAACPRCASENADTAKFCSECGAPLAAPAPREQRKTVSVLFCDVTGSTALGERTDPEALRGIMSRYFDTARAAIERHGGTVEKFIGDAVMAVFGVPTVHEDDALRAVRAAAELRDAVEIDVRIGVNTGEVVTGGADTLATGDAVNVAARLEQAAGSGEIYLGAETYALVRDAVDAELLPPLEAKGKSEPLTAYRLRAVTGELRRRDAAPMVGRTRELDLLARAYERAEHERACHLFTLLGPAGMGKSRLVAEFLARLAGARVVHGRCLSYGEGITYWPVVSVLKQLDIPVESVLRDGTTPQEIAWAVRKALEEAALDAPLVVVFDDIQWGEATFLDLVEHVADLSRGTPILLLCMARPELLDARPGWGGGKHNATSVLLEPLPSDEAATLVQALFAGADDALVARIRDAADGNPLFVEEMVELARTSGGDVAVPPTIHALLTARLDSLPAEERVVLERGAVEGQVFHRSAVAALAPDELQVDSRLVSLVRKELVRPDQPAFARDDAYRFRHLLIRDAAYEALPKATRIELHERFAAWLEEHGDDLVELDEIVGYHYEQAARYAAELGRPRADAAALAADHLAAAARRAESRADVGAVANLAARAVALLEPGDPRRLALLPPLGAALHSASRLEEALAVLDEAVEQGDRITAARARVYRTHLRSHGAGVSMEESLAEIDRALADLGEDGPPAALASAYTTRALVLFFGGRNTLASRDAALATEHAARSGDSHALGAAVEALLTTLNWSETPWSEIEQRVREFLDSDEVGPRTHARLLANLARCVWARRDFEQGRALLADATRRLVDLGQTMHATAQRMVSANLEWIVGDMAAVESITRGAWDELGRQGERGFRSTLGAQLADALVHFGRLEEAEAVLAEAESISAPDDYVTNYMTLGQRARIAAARGDAAAATDLARRARETVDVTDAFEHRIYARITSAEAAVALGDTAAAGRLVDEAVALAERKGSLSLADRARAVLATMAA